MQTQWDAFLRAYRDLLAAEQEDDASIDRAWSALSAVARNARQARPYHIALVLRHLERLAESRASGEIAILEHGCGSGHTLLYLAALGYSNVHGVDVGGKFAPLNRILNRVLGGTEARLKLYDGTTIPFGDAMFDFVFSEQVIEHVADAVFDSYYSEEARALKPGGTAVHYVPHRLVPYESHTVTWFLHYLPKALHHRVSAALGAPVPDHLHLRWPWVHRRKMREALGDCRDSTLERFALVDDLPYYDGPKQLRRVLGTLLKLPVLGRTAGSLLRHFVMLETVSTKRVPVAESASVSQR